MAWKLSSFAIPCWMLLITASSDERRSVSFSRRCVSSKSRAFSSATPMLAATVDSSRTSASPKAFSRSMFSTDMNPSRRSPAKIGTATPERLMSVPSATISSSAR